ncbi:hypothetical protein EI94DRAFT_53575 [Lactarius quietus]|nr:hypothetical protein EI94DRAFT_53575 [Lactarius quietus]
MDVGEGCCVRVWPANQVRSRETRPSLTSPRYIRYDTSTFLFDLRRVHAFLSVRPCARIIGAENFAHYFRSGLDRTGLCPPRSRSLDQFPHRRHVSEVLSQKTTSVLRCFLSAYQRFVPFDSSETSSFVLGLLLVLYRPPSAQRPPTSPE